MKSSNEFEDILQEALSEYRDAEPLAGIEDRVLYRLRMQAERRQRLKWRWAVGAMATALVTVAVWIGLSARAPRGTIPAPMAERQAPPAQPPTVAPQYARVTPKSVLKASHSQQRQASDEAVMASAGREPMRERFPAPLPLTQQEAALLALARTNPAPLQSLQQTDTTADIAPLTIKPLAETAGGAEGEN